jgi:hypothetical protein
MRVTVTTRVGLKMNVEGSTHTEEGAIDIHQGQILKTIAVMRKSGGQPRRTTLGAADAVINHQMTTLILRAR